MTLFVFAYHLFNILCLFLGNPAGDFMMKCFLKMAEYKARNVSSLSSTFNYMYYHYLL